MRQHADAAKRCIRAGFDGTEITSFMGYLSPTSVSLTNQRTDEYGGSIQVEAASWGRSASTGTPDNPLIVRLNGASYDKYELSARQMLVDAAGRG